MPKEITQALSISSNLIDTLDLTTSLRMESCAEANVGAHGLLKVSKNLEVKMLPWSEEITYGIPCNETIREV